jgi:hypothetical protein
LPRFDPANDPYEHLNSSGILDDTPIGTLRVVNWGVTASVCVMDDEDPTLIRRITHTLKVGENPLDAIYGKRTQEQDAVTELYVKRNEVRDASEARADDDLSRDFVNELDTFERRHDEGKEAVIGFAGLGKVDVQWR